MNLLIYFLAIYAISFIITENTELDDIRYKIIAYFTFHPIAKNLADKLMTCIFCMSFWLGLISSFFLFSGCPFTYAFACYGIAVVIDKLSP